jgi:hypothetical protein
VAWSVFVFFNEYSMAQWAFWFACHDMYEKVPFFCLLPLRNLLAWILERLILGETLKLFLSVCSHNKLIVCQILGHCTNGLLFKELEIWYYKSAGKSLGYVVSLIAEQATVNN